MAVTRTAFLSRTRSEISARWHAPTPALPIDIFRVLVGLLSAAYFLRLFLDAADISGPDGLIDHELTSQIFWYTRFGFFRPGMSTAEFQAIFACASLASLALAAGWRSKLMAAFMFVVAVSAYRWNFLVIYVDDGIMHLAIFWMLLLPIGRTLVLGEWLRDRNAAVDRWSGAMVPGGPVRAFLVSLTLVYVVAGMWKWTSPMWRSGTALYAVLQTPIAWTPELWKPSHFPFISAADYMTLILEPLFPLMFILRTNHKLKWALLPAMIGFHVGIIATMKVPFANVACLAAIAIIFRNEIMLIVQRKRQVAVYATTTRASGFCAVGSVAFVTVLTLAMMGEAAVPAWRGSNRADERVTARTRSTAHAGFLGTQHNPFYVPLYAIGIAQSYRLFDWIDDRNFGVRYDITMSSPASGPRHIDPESVFPSSIRGVLLQTYIHDVTWGSIPRDRADELKMALYSRFADRYCKGYPGTAEIAVSSAVSRVSLATAERFPAPTPLMSFRCAERRAQVTFARLGHDRVFATAATGADWRLIPVNGR
ncbi:MAG: hypothetical protein ABI681_13510 [Gemmatimonadales bacterium]